MSAPRFLADNDLHDRIVDSVLRLEPAVTFVRAREVGMDRATDAEVLAYANEHGLLIVSHDANTMTAAASERLARGEHFPGLLIVPQRRRGDPMIVNTLLAVFAASEAEEWRDRIEFLPF